MLNVRWAGVRFGLHGLLAGLLLAGVVLGYPVQVLILFGSLLAHELAHLVAARLAGVEVEEILLTPVGGMARLDPALEADPQEEVSVALAGPFQSCFLAALAYFLAGNRMWDRELLAFWFEVNASLAFFNLLPALPLDGGRALRGLLAQRLGYDRVSRWMALSGRLTGIAVTLGGLVALAAGRVYWTALVGGPVLAWAAGREERVTLYRAFRQVLRKPAELRERRVLPAVHLVAVADARLREVLPHLAARRCHLVLVVDPQLRPLATMAEPELARAFTQLGPEVRLRDLLEVPPRQGPRHVHLGRRQPRVRLRRGAH